jgi:tRNA-Thr(GGU) m(6)t(6)A37 methyltransferase TsaA
MLRHERAVERKTEHDASPPAALMAAAFRVFAARGYRATRLEEVAREAGMTKGAIYYHFHSKEDLLRRAVEHRHEAIFARIESELAALEAPASVKIRYVLRQFWGHVLEPVWGQAVRLMFGEVGIEFPALFRMWAEEGPIQGWTVVSRLIEEGVRRGEFRPGVDPEVSARLAVSGLMMQSMLQVHSSLQDVAPCDVDRILDSGVDLFLHGLAVTHQSRRPTGPGAFSPIGHVENDLDPAATGESLRSAVSRIVVDPELTDGLSGLEAGGRLLVLYWLHRAEPGALLQHPRGDTERPVRGVFALRSPNRPNPIGATEVELIARKGNVLEVRGLDAIDGTPVLDLKPA